MKETGGLGYPYADGRMILEFKETVQDGLSWICLAQDAKPLRAFVNIADTFCTAAVTISFSGRSLQHELNTF
jgi:hypothetical protein